MNNLRSLMSGVFATLRFRSVDTSSHELWSTQAIPKHSRYSRRGYPDSPARSERCLEAVSGMLVSFQRSSSVRRARVSAPDIFERFASNAFTSPRYDSVQVTFALPIHPFIGQSIVFPPPPPKDLCAASDHCRRRARDFWYHERSTSHHPTLTLPRNAYPPLLSRPSGRDSNRSNRNVTTLVIGGSFVFSPPAVSPPPPV